MEAIGKSVPKKDSFDKVTGAAQYTGDHTDVKMLYARMTISSFAHARIIGIDTTEACRIPGVRAILTGEYSDVLTGEEIRDRPVIAKERVRLNASEVISVQFAVSDHAAMETGSAIAEIKPDGHIYIESSTQAPFAVKKYMARYFDIEPGRIVVKTPFVGGLSKMMRNELAYHLVHFLLFTYAVINVVVIRVFEQILKNRRKT